MSLLEHLPLELLQAILEELDFASLANLSLVNKAIRSLCLPFLFQCVSFTFSTADFDSLMKLVLSPIGSYVKALKYYTPPILKDSNMRPFPIQPFQCTNDLNKFPKALVFKPYTLLSDIFVTKAKTVGKRKTVSICGTWKLTIF